MNKSVIYELAIGTTKLLLKNQYSLANITWRNGEANIDSGFSKLACYCCTKAWNTMKVKYPQFRGIGITCESPDISATFTYPDGRKENHKMELKSSTKARMPGSTIRRLDVNQPLIFCLRPSTVKGVYKIRCSQYHRAMGESNMDLFQDRTPRPSLNFDKMADVDDAPAFENRDKKSWVDHYAICAVNRIDVTQTCQPSWQDSLVNKIIEEYVGRTSTAQFELDKIACTVERLVI